MSTTTGRPLLSIGDATAEISREAARRIRPRSGRPGRGYRRATRAARPSRPDAPAFARGRDRRATRGLLEHDVERLDVMPALGTHQPLGPAECRLMFGDAIDPARVLHHRWRDDVTTIGELPADEVDDGRRALSRSLACRSRSTERSWTTRTISWSPSGRSCRTRWPASVATRSTSRSGSAADRRFSAATSSAPSTGSSRRWGGSTRRSGSCSTAASIVFSSRDAGCCSPSPSSTPATPHRSCAASSPARAAPVRRVAMHSGRQPRSPPT